MVKRGLLMLGLLAGLGLAGFVAVPWLVPEKTGPGVTQSNHQRIKKGMTRSEIQWVLGHHPTEMVSGRNGTDIRCSFHGDWSLRQSHLIALCRKTVVAPCCVLWYSPFTQDKNMSVVTALLLASMMGSLNTGHYREIVLEVIRRLGCQCDTSLHGLRATVEIGSSTDKAVLLSYRLEFSAKNNPWFIKSIERIGVCYYDEMGRKLGTREIALIFPRAAFRRREVLNDSFPVFIMPPKEAIMFTVELGNSGLITRKLAIPPLAKFRN